MNRTALFDEVRAEARARGVEDDLAKFVWNGAKEEDDLESYLDALERAAILTSERRLCGNPVKVAIQKLIRRCAKFYVEPIVREQSRSNMLMVQTLREMADTLRALEESADKGGCA